MDVDFQTNPNIAVNEQAILSGSATRAAVQDSNYTTARVINPRYKGCELTIYASQSAAQNYTQLFGYFNYIQFVGQNSQYDEGISDVQLIALIDLDGNSIVLNSKNNNVGLVQSTFNNSSASMIYPTVNTGSIVSSSRAYQVLEGGAFVSIDGGGGYTRSLNEQSVAIKSYPLFNPFNQINVTQSGLIIPSTINPYFTGSFVQLAQQAGYFKTL
jgi:hypothetical protein